MLRRYVALREEKIDRAARTVPLTFSSEFPALQKATDDVPESIRSAAGLRLGDIYIEVLDHEPESVDLSLLNNNGAFLDEHDAKDQLGVVERAEVSDRKGKAVVRMATHEKGEKRLGEMEGKVRTHISTGYKYTRFLKEDKLPNGRRALRFAWRALEISSVATPADPTVGIERDYKDLPEPAEQNSNNQPATPRETSSSNNGGAVDSGGSVNVDDVAKRLSPEQKIRMKNLLFDPAATTTAGGGGAAVIDEPKVRENERGLTRAAFKKRHEDITAIADTLIKNHGKRNGGQMAEKIRSMANQALVTEEAVDAFQVRCLTEVMNSKPADPILIQDCTDDPSQYSILRGIQSCVRRGGRLPDGREGEVHQEILRRSQEHGGLGYDAQGFQVPANAPLRVGRSEVTERLLRSARGMMTRDMQATVFGAGGAFVPTTLQLPVIELLRNRLVLDQAGMRTMAGLQGNILIPRQEAAATAYSVSEIGLLADSQQVLGQIALAPRRVGATQPYSKQFVMQSSPDAESFMRDDLLKVIALRWDYLGINGQGAGDEPLGILHTPGIASIIFGTTPTYIKMLAFRTAIRKANVIDPLTWLSTPDVEGSLSGIAEALTGATTVGGAQNAIWKPGPDQSEGRVINIPAIASNQIPNQLVILGAFTHLIHAIWGGLDVVVDPFGKKKNAEIEITMNTWGDFAVRHAQAFCASVDAGNQ